jgi:hypothetical protein
MRQINRQVFPNHHPKKIGAFSPGHQPFFPLFGSHAAPSVPHSKPNMDKTASPLVKKPQ